MSKYGSISYKKYNIIIISLLLLFLLTNYLIYSIYTKELIEGKKGDLARIGYLIIDNWQEKPNNVSLKHKEIKFDIDNLQNIGNIDVLTIGDSFSNGSGGSYYQDYLASSKCLSVANLPVPPGKDAVDVAISLLNSGYLNLMKPKYIIIESVGREVIGRYGNPKNRNWDQRVNQSMIFKNNKEQDAITTNTHFINEGNFKFIFWNLLNGISRNMLVSQVYRTKLSVPMFTAGENSNQLFFFSEDIHNISQINDDSVQGVNKTFNDLSEKLRTHNIDLFIMIAVDKYDLYMPYIENNKYPVNTLFEKLRPLDKKYRFVDTKDILSRHLATGEKDLYPIGDTHWSWKASQILSESINIDSDKIN